MHSLNLPWQHLKAEIISSRIASGHLQLMLQLHFGGKLGVNMARTMGDTRAPHAVR